MYLYALESDRGAHHLWYVGPYIHIHTHTHIYIYIFIYLFIYYLFIYLYLYAFKADRGAHHLWHVGPLDAPGDEVCIHIITYIHIYLFTYIHKYICVCVPVLARIAPRCAPSWRRRAPRCGRWRSRAWRGACRAGAARRGRWSPCPVGGREFKSHFQIRFERSSPRLHPRNLKENGSSRLNVRLGQLTLGGAARRGR